MLLTEKEHEVIHDLLVQHGITQYELVPTNFENAMPPESTFPKEVHKMAGYVVTPATVYSFWLDWYEGHYTLGHEDDCWEEETDLTQLGSDGKMLEKVQQEVRQKFGV